MMERLKAANSNKFIIQQARQNTVAIDRILNDIQAGKPSELGRWIYLAHNLMDNAEEFSS
jgi:hypothetical protein